MLNKLSCGFCLKPTQTNVAKFPPSLIWKIGWQISQKKTIAGSPTTQHNAIIRKYLKWHTILLLIYMSRNQINFQFSLFTVGEKLEKWNTIDSQIWLHSTLEFFLIFSGKIATQIFLIHLIHLIYLIIKNNIMTEGEQAENILETMLFWKT